MSLHPSFLGKRQVSIILRRFLILFTNFLEMLYQFII
jgi:hypothetical protein